MFDRVRDLFRLFSQFGPGVQPVRFLWYLAGYGDRSGEIRFRIRSLGRSPVAVRPGTSDLIVLYETFGASYDAPPAFLSPTTTRRIWDLGANIGLTAARYAAAFPHARVTAVELDRENAALARRNLAPFSDRCEVRTGAVWMTDGTIEYRMESGMEHGATVMGRPSGDGVHRAEAWSLNTLLKDDARVDFIKMDIEGAEAEILKTNTEWALKVACIKVECHTPYTVAQAQADLAKLGFEVDVDTSHWASVIAHNKRPVFSIPGEGG